MIVESYDYIVKSGKFEEYLQIFESERRHEIDGAYGTRFNPTCYQYFRNLYPEATDDEILKYTRVYFYFVLEDSIYVALTSSTRLQKMESVSKKSEQYTLLRVDGVGELTEKLINSNVDFLCEDTLRHSIILNEVLNKYDYKVLAETSCNVVGFNYYNLGFTQSEEFPNLGMIPISISGFNKETNRKYFYFVTTSHPSKRYFYYAEADEFYTPKDKDYFLDFVLFSGNEKISTRKIGDVVYFNSYYEDVDIEYDN
ncbi:MAG: hypothetical protein IJW79_10975 [Clostridia bacterium]|nr:hypothetical protein [Clostridia bacterium]